MVILLWQVRVDRLLKIIQILNNRIITGGSPNGGTGTTDDVLKYDAQADKWIKVGRLAVARYYHATSLVPNETAKYCVWWILLDISYM